MNMGTNVGVPCFRQTGGCAEERRRLVGEPVRSPNPYGVAIGRAAFDVLLSGEAVISLYGPEPIHEAQALVDWQPYWGMIQPHRPRRGWSPNVS